MNRLALALIASAMALPSDSSGCTMDMTLSEVIAKSEKDFKSNPRSTIHECFRPFIKLVNDEDRVDTRERFLYLVVTKTAQRPPRPYNLDLVIDAGELYFSLIPMPRGDRVAKVLAEWGRALQLTNRPQALQTVLSRYARTTRDPRYLSAELVGIWIAALRCDADPEGCRFPAEFECALARKCGPDDQVVAYLRLHRDKLPPWEELRNRLQMAVQDVPSVLAERRDEIESILKQVRP
ncbi:MAG TPA: hypothetical protein VNN08_12200 [Thermoanaerobaculia bacterium]|nr:hypothetical protein [Thermoanaerobaculia bacterium]